MKQLSPSVSGNIACLVAYTIFGFNIVCNKNLADSGAIEPMAVFFFRSFGAMVLFWMGSLGHPGAVEKRDLLKIAAASFLGMFLVQASFVLAVPKVTAIDVSVLSLMTPMMAMLAAYFFLKEKITRNKLLGLLISFAGVLFLVLNTVTGRAGAEKTTLEGFLLIVVNTSCFACYVALFKPLAQKYPVVTYMKWMFLFSTLYCLPFSIPALGSSRLDLLTPGLCLQLGFVVVFATFVAYYLIAIGQKQVSPTVVCIYSYVQPVVAMGVSICIGIDTLSWSKALATLLVFAGVLLINHTK